MKNELEYKGYRTEIEIDFPSHLSNGKIEGIRDLVNFESESVSGIEREFHEAVDEYLEFLNEIGEGEALRA